MLFNEGNNIIMTTLNYNSHFYFCYFYYEKS